MVSGIVIEPNLYNLTKIKTFNEPNLLTDSDIKIIQCQPIVSFILKWMYFNAI